MNLDEEIDFIWGLAVPKGKEWQRKDCPIVRSNKGDLRKAWEKASKLTDIKTVELAVQAQAIARRSDRQSGGFVPQPKMVGSWLREERWADEIIPPEQKREVISERCQCGRPSLGPQIGKCAEHAIRSDEKEMHERRKKYMTKAGLHKRFDGETTEDYFKRCHDVVTGKTDVKKTTTKSDANQIQCDGCVSNLPISNGMHLDENNKPYMTCEKWKYI